MTYSTALGKRGHVKHSLPCLFEDLAKNTSECKQTDLTLLDFSKAYEKVSHSKAPPVWDQRTCTILDPGLPGWPVKYASTVWSPYTKKNIDQIEMVQRRAARWVTNRYSSYDSVSAMLGNLGWRSLENHRYDSRLAMFYKIQYGLVAVLMPSYFERPKKITRHSLKNPLSFRQV